VMNEERAQCIAAAEQWERVAAADEEMAVWNRKHGFDLSESGKSAGDYNAEVARRCARTLRLEAATGEPHCMCHERPKRLCPNGGMGVRI
jgi:hypothetical protein